VGVQSRKGAATTAPAVGIVTIAAANDAEVDEFALDAEIEIVLAVTLCRRGGGEQFHGARSLARRGLRQQSPTLDPQISARTDNPTACDVRLTGTHRFSIPS
jgi:hypothetical protein